MRIPWTEPDAAEAEACRERMISEQIAARGIRDPRILAAFRRVPRHLFCPPGTSLAQAYGDHPLPIGHGQTISQPLMVAEMTARLQLREDTKALEVGTGSGYQAAILACLVAEVHTVERLVPLADEARDRLARLGFANVRVHAADGTLGWPVEAPYDAIVVTAAAPAVPESLKRQLADRGCLAIPVGPRHLQELLLVERHGQQFVTHQGGGCRFVPLIGREGWSESTWFA